MSFCEKEPNIPGVENNAAVLLLILISFAEPLVDLRR